METIDKIKQQIEENTILLYMKGSPKLPSCGFFFSGISSANGMW